MDTATNISPSPGQPRPPAESIAAEPQRLDALVAERSGEVPLAAIIDGAEALILGRAANGSIEVYSGGMVRHLMPDVTAVPIHDHGRQCRMFPAALAAMQQKRNEIQQDWDSTLDTLRRVEDEHATTLASIRAYAINKHRQGDICRDGLDAFLTEFNLDPYQPQTRVEYTITGWCLINNDDTDAVENDVCDYLKPDLGDIEDVEDEGDHSVRIDNTSVIDND